MQTPRTIIYPYKMGSRSAKDIAMSVGALRVHPNGRYRPRPTDTIVNWGNSLTPTWIDRANRVGARILNKPKNVRLASNKILTFETLKNANVNIPKFTTNIEDLENWEGKVYVRSLVNSSQGNGIEIIDLDEMFYSDIPYAPLYTQAIDVKAEYRVHVFNGEVIDYVKKMRKVDDIPDEHQLQVRNHKNGWIFCREGLNRLERIEKLAIDSVKALGLDFGAVDIVRDQDNECFVLEINTACGMEETTLSKYSDNIKLYADR